MAPFFVDLSARTKLRVTGPDRLRFLNGQTTNDVRKSSAEATQETCVLNARGHLDAHLFLFATDDAIWIDADDELRALLPARLERYVIADDVIVEDVTDRFALFHVFSQTKPAIAEATFCLSARRLLHAGWDLWSARAEAAKIKETLLRENSLLDPGAYEALRVQSGIPRWGRELTPEIIPPEAGLQDRAIDYEKGCYIGQEVISRMKMSGQVRQRLCGVVALAGGELAPGMELQAEGKVAGKITSAIFSEQINAHIGLAMIKRGFSEAGKELLAIAGEERVNVCLTALPFTSGQVNINSLTN